MQVLRPRTAIVLKFGLHRRGSVNYKARINVPEKHAFVELNIAIFLIGQRLVNALGHLNLNYLVLLLYSESLLDNVVFCSVSRRNDQMHHFFIDLAMARDTLQVCCAFDEFSSPSHLYHLGANLVFDEYLENWESLF